jgi:RNA polymerase sigma factor (sigma-70 family)
MDDPDVVLATAAASGDQEAFENLRRRHDNRVEKIVRIILKASCVDFIDHVEDAKQEIWVKILSRLGTYKGSKGSFETWSNAVARNASIDYAKRFCRSRDLLEALDEGVFQDLSNLNTIEDGIAARMYVTALLTCLSDDERRIIELTFNHGLTDIEIARILDASPSAIKTRRFRAISRMRAQALSDERDEENK